MTIRRVLYQSEFKAPFLPALPTPPPFGGQREFQDWVEISQHRTLTLAAAVALLQFSAFGGTVFPPKTPQFTPFDAPQAAKYRAAEQQFSAWHSPFFGTRTPSYLSAPVPFDTPQAPKYNAAEQQFSAYSGTVFRPLTPEFTAFDAPEAPRVSAAQQQFSANTFTVAASTTTLIAAFTSTPFDTPQAKPYGAWQQQFTAFNGLFVGPPPPEFTPFDEAIGKPYPAGAQQFTAWHSPFFGTQTPSSLAAFVPFDAPQAPKFGVGQQQFTAYSGTFVAAAITPDALSTFYVDTTIPRLALSPALVQFADLPMGPELTTAEAAIIGRWGPDETEEERRRRIKFWEDDDRFKREWSEDLFHDVRRAAGFEPDPVPHPPHEPQRWEDEPAAVHGADAGPGLFAVDVPQEEPDILDDPEVLDLLEGVVQLMMTGWRK